MTDPKPAPEESPANVFVFWRSSTFPYVHSGKAVALVEGGRARLAPYEVLGEDEPGEIVTPVLICPPGEGAALVRKIAQIELSLVTQIEAAKVEAYKALSALQADQPAYGGLIPKGVTDWHTLREQALKDQDFATFEAFAKACKVGRRSIDRWNVVVDSEYGICLMGDGAEQIAAQWAVKTTPGLNKDEICEDLEGIVRQHFGPDIRVVWGLG